MPCTAEATAWQQTISAAHFQHIQPSRRFDVGWNETNPHLRFPVLSALPVTPATTIHPNAAPHALLQSRRHGNHGKIVLPSPAAELSSSPVFSQSRVCPSQFILPSCRCPNRNRGRHCHTIMQQRCFKWGDGVREAGREGWA